MDLNTQRALVVLSGGQDSTTTLFVACEQHGAQNIEAITFDYGQVHKIEIGAAIKVGRMARISAHHFVHIENVLLSASPLTNGGKDLEKYEDAGQMADVIGDRIEKTFVPMRNALFLTIAANYAVARGCGYIYTGVCQEDNANYPDCRQSFIDATERYIDQALGGGGPIIRTPLMNLSKADTCRLAFSMSECWKALAYTHTSYDGKYPPTDMNHANVLRAYGFETADLPDPLVVRANSEGLMELPITFNYDSMR